MRARLLVLLLSLSLGGLGAAGGLLHVCQAMGGLVAGDCDCETQADGGAHAEHGEAARHAARRASVQIEPQPCCTVELSKASEWVATQEATSPRVDESSVALMSLTEGRLIASRRVCDLGLFRERAPPNIHGPPLFVRHCSFLN